MADEHDEQEETEGAGWRLSMPFWLEAECYSPRDHEMFVAGFEFAGIVRRLETDDDAFEMTIHPENESRSRMAAGRLGRRATTEPLAEGWSTLRVEAR